MVDVRLLCLFVLCYYSAAVKDLVGNAVDLPWCDRGYACLCSLSRTACYHKSVRMSPSVQVSDVADLLTGKTAAL